MTPTNAGLEARLEGLSPALRAPVEAMIARHPPLAEAAGALIDAYHAIARAQATDGCLYLCGNGGSMADAVHISAEMLKSYTLPRPLGDDLRARLAAAGPDGEMLGHALERGLRAMVLGLNHSLSSALENDVATPAIGYAQELLVMARPGDVLLGISTSGNARNVCYAAHVARALGLIVVSLTGAGGGRLPSLADIAIRAPAAQTDRVQELHVQLYHCLCEMLEIRFFG
ncbi:MAG TPA: SIS domain-containing protein [Anaerolineae bacterium]|nr:SIS domain-containing protein [Anaerolineae bacterium]